MWLLKTSEWRTRTSKFPVQLHWARAHKCDSGLSGDRWTQSSEDKQMFRDSNLISRRDLAPSSCSKHPQMERVAVEIRQKERGEKRQRRDIKRRTREGREPHSGEQESGEKGKRKNSRSGRESVFILICTQSEGSVSAIVPGLPVKTVRLPQRLFISAPL